MEAIHCPVDLSPRSFALLLRWLWEGALECCRISCTAVEKLTIARMG